MVERPRFPDLRLTDIARMACAVRPLPIALAHEFAKDTEDEARMAVLARLYVALSDADQVRCLCELSRCRTDQVMATFDSSWADGGDEAHHWR
jgi:hypothetical protein